MELEGSCHCGKTGFTVISNTPAPFMRCYCSICRKTNGGGGYAINIMGQYKSLKVRGKEHLKEYRAIRDKEIGDLCGNIRYFCGECGCHLYAYNKEYADSVYPLASCIDTPLPVVDPVKDAYYIMRDSKANWAVWPEENKHSFEHYPNISIHDWHVKHKQFVKDE
ncbi:Mss4-like protein [Gongronella butleri]|nr:Mss4-like protein [Gongronella butleri]